MLEGYGLTESSPVLTVARPGNKLLKGSVGKPLPGVEVKIGDPDANGVGEVLARGQNVMLGYYNNEEATEAVLQDRWLRTGDLGRIDEDGNLYIVGRSKDVIIDSNGKNIYPDEIEELYSKFELIKELSVVGLPDEEGGEKIASLVVPDYEKEIALSRADVNKKIEEHFREVSADLPFFKRVKVVHGKYLLGAANMTFEEFFGRLERLSGVRAPGLRMPKRMATAGSNLIESVFTNWGRVSPVASKEVDQAEHFWYFDSTKAREALGFEPRDPQETLNDTIKYLRGTFLGEDVFAP